MPRVVLATWRERSPYGDPENEAIAAALRKLGIDSILWPWRDGPAPDADLCIVRTVWDYTQSPAEFLSWLDSTARSMPVENPPSIVRWNHHKRYLVELAERGVRLPQTWLVPPGGRCPEAERLVRVVVKPAIGAAGRGAEKVAGRDLAEALARSTVETVVQPFLAEIATEGERSLVYFDREFSHAVVKRPASGEFRVQALYGGRSAPHEPTLEEREAARKALLATGSDLLYARVDLVPTAEGHVLMELEAIEPLLFLHLAPGSAERFAAAIARRLGK